MSLTKFRQENKNQMFEILKNNEEFLNKEENKDLKMLILYLKNEQRQNEYTIKCLRNGVEELDKELQKERKVKKDILKAWKEDRENLETLLKRERKENRIVKNIIKGSGEDDLKLEIKRLKEQLKSEHKLS